MYIDEVVPRKHRLQAMEAVMKGTPHLCAGAVGPLCSVYVSPVPVTFIIPNT